MKRYAVHLKPPGKLSRYTFNERCKGRQRYWWLKGPDGQIDIGEHRGDQPLDLMLELPPGRYTAGCGPAEPRGIRHCFTVSKSGARNTASIDGYEGPSI